MNIRRKALALFLGDIAFFILALWGALAIRYLEAPSLELFETHLVPFSILFAVWVLVFFIAGLYDKQTGIFRHRLPRTILNAQIFNIIIAALFFFLIPYFGITPKTILFIYLLISFGLITFWRLSLFPFISPKRKLRALLVASGKEADELWKEINDNPQYPFSFVDRINPSEGSVPEHVLESTRAGKYTFVVVDFKNERIEPVLQLLYQARSRGLGFVALDFPTVYEDIFDRIPPTLIGADWLFVNGPSLHRRLYSILKRVMDVILGLFGGALSLAFYPFVIAAIKVDDGGSVFIVQKRIGKNNRLFSVRKFRTMTGNDSGNYGPSGKTTLSVTRVGKWLRLSRIDELPQLWSVVLGTQSLIGPRPELPALVDVYAKEIPHYNLRHLVKPGLSGWAQIYHKEHPHHGTAVEETTNKLSYDLYYLKNRSLALDFVIVLKTVKTLLSRSGL